jgi:hypothetical protein
VAGLEPIWHVIIGGQRQGPLTEDQVLTYLGDGRLAADDFVWCPDFPDWKRAGEIGDNRPLEPVLAQAVVESGDLVQDDRDIVDPAIAVQDIAFQNGAEPADEPRLTEASSAGAAWNLWASANVGMLVSALLLLLQIGRGQGFALANDVHTASAAAIGGLIGRILGVPLLFVLLALLRNFLKRPRPASPVNVLRHGLAFAALLVCMLGGLKAYGEFVFASTEIIGGDAQKSFIADAYGACLRKQYAGGLDISDPQVDKYCICTSQKMAASTTYRQLGSYPDANARAELKQKMEAVNDACR